MHCLSRKYKGRAFNTDNSQETPRSDCWPVHQADSHSNDMVLGKLSQNSLQSTHSIKPGDADVVH